jgi:glutamyl-tRNA reductase
MPLLALGVNHKTAPLDIREKVVFAADMAAPLLKLKAATQAKEAAILSTCNRTELYCTNVDAQQVINWLHDYQQLPQQSLQNNLYIYQNDVAVKHLLRVASGLDSMVIGEPQILGQLKSAYSFADTAGTIGKQLRHLFQYVFSIAKLVRTETAVGEHPVCIASAAIDVAKRIFADLSKMRVLLIGAGETIDLMVKHLQSANVSQFYIANRTLNHAEKMAAEINGTALSLDAISEFLPQVDIVIAATASQTPILTKLAIESALKKYKRRIMLMIDLAVPRDIDPKAAELEDVYLYSLDDLQTIIAQHLTHRQQAALQAEKMIDLHAVRYMRSLKIADIAPVINAYRGQAEQIQAAELQRAQELLTAGVAAEEVLTELAHRLTNKLLHTPTQYLRQIAFEQQEELLHVARRLQDKAR